MNEPIEVWTITRTDDARGHLYDLMSRLCGSTRNVDPYYHRTVRIGTEIRTIRGRFELLIRSEKERQDMWEKLHSSPHGKHAGLRRVTEEELRAIAELERAYGKELGGVLVIDYEAAGILPPGTPAAQTAPAPPASAAAANTEERAHGG